MNRHLVHYILAFFFFISVASNVVTLTGVRLSDATLGIWLALSLALILGLFFLGAGEKNYLRLFYETLAGPPTGSTEYAYIDGEVAAMDALTKATKRARRHIRATRFFPLPIRARGHKKEGIKRVRSLCFPKWPINET